MLVMVQVVLGDLGDRMRHQDNDRGATAVEYGLLVALIAGVIIAIVTTLGGQLNTIFGNVVSDLTPVP